MTRRAGGSLAILAAGAVLAIVGAAVLDDYGVSTDEDAQRLRAETYWRHFADGAELRFAQPHNRFYGVAFDLPLLLAEKALGLDDRRHVYLLRHAASHLLFLAGALSCALLARRMTGSTVAALLALALFALQPRIYAHSFFNSKDVTALALFAVCLWLAHRAFRRGGADAFLLCGAGVAVLTNLRLSAGLTLAIAVAAARVLDLAPRLRSGGAPPRPGGGGGFRGRAGRASSTPYRPGCGPAAPPPSSTQWRRSPATRNPAEVLFQGPGPLSRGAAGALLPGVVRGFDAAGPAGPRPCGLGRRAARRAAALRPPARRVLGRPAAGRRARRRPRL